MEGLGGGLPGKRMNQSRGIEPKGGLNDGGKECPYHGNHGINVQILHGTGVDRRYKIHSVPNPVERVKGRKGDTTSCETIATLSPLK